MFCEGEIEIIQFIGERFFYFCLGFDVQTFPQNPLMEVTETNNFTEGFK